MTANTQKTVAPGAETPETLANEKRLKELVAQVTKLGEEAALGQDSLPKLAHAVVRAAADGVIDVATKNAKGEDAAHQIYTKYASGQSKKSIHEHSAGGLKGNVSKLRQLISLGAMTTIDAVAVMQAAFDAREGMKNESGVKVKPSYPYYIEVAREQLKLDRPLTQRELEALVVVEGPDAKTVEGELRRAMKILEQLITGENKSKIKDTHAKTEEAFNALRDRLATMVLDQQRRELMAKAAALGIKLA
jgi:hypothetical protein